MQITQTGATDIDPWFDLVWSRIVDNIRNFFWRPINCPQGRVGDGGLDVGCCATCSTNERGGATCSTNERGGAACSTNERGGAACSTNERGGAACSTSEGAGLVRVSPARSPSRARGFPARLNTVRRALSS
ncbi:hypothetical protein GCM10027026_29620 [Myroides odoratimimus subsp. xuanwuensis]